MSRRPVLLYACRGVDSDAWLAALRRELPEVEIRESLEAGSPADIEFAFIWKHPPGLLRRLPNLRAILSLGAGVESILADPDLPPGVPLVRMVDPGLAIGMNEFVLLRVLHYHRGMPQHERNQTMCRWERSVPPLPEQRRVGILGLGALGGMCAHTLRNLRFDVAGWSRTPKHLDGIRTFAGDAGLTELLRRSEILVCLLPLTPQTEGILNRNTLAELPRGAFVINVARGQHVIDADLIAALDSGHVAGATLDAFRVEPLPSGHPFWSHPRITVLPHVAAITQVKTAAQTLANNVRAVLAGKVPQHVVDRNQGY